MGNEVAAGCETAERKGIEKQLKGLMQRFDALTSGAQQRMLDLEQAMKVRKLMLNVLAISTRIFLFGSQVSFTTFQF